jgi:predicted transcriptional regulator
VNDATIIREIALARGPAVFAVELTGPLDMSRQGVDRRLRDLQDKGLVNSKKAGRARMWWVSDDGWKLLEESRSD